MTAGEPEIKLERHGNRASLVPTPRAFNAAMVSGRASYAAHGRIERQLNIRGSTGCGAPHLPQRGE